MDIHTLEQENRQFAGTPGVSRHQNACHPAFLNKRNGQIELSRMKNGTPCPIHLIDWLPIEWAEVIDMNGAIKVLQPDIVAGFVKNGLFYTREEAARL